MWVAADGDIHSAIIADPALDRVLSAGEGAQDRWHVGRIAQFEAHIAGVAGRGRPDVGVAQRMRDRAVPARTAPSTWHVQIDGKRAGLSDARRYARLCRHGDAGDVCPSGEGLGAAGPTVRGGVVVSVAGENVGDLVMGGKEALNLPRRLEPLHDPLVVGSVDGSFRPGY